MSSKGFFCEYQTINMNKYELSQKTINMNEYELSQICCMAQGQQMIMHNQVLNLVFEIIVTLRNETI